MTRDALEGLLEASAEQAVWELALPMPASAPTTGYDHVVLDSDPAGAEFQGEVFSHNFIYGYYKGELMFLEPMVSLAYLQSLPEMSSPVKKPQRYSYPGWYPGTYQIGYDAGKGEYRIAIRNLQRYE